VRQLSVAVSASPSHVRPEALADVTVNRALYRLLVDPVLDSVTWPFAAVVPLSVKVARTLPFERRICNRTVIDALPTG
jgi:hypothetical protein